MEEEKVEEPSIEKDYRKNTGKALKAIGIILLVYILIMVGIWLLDTPEPSFHIYVKNCTLTNWTDTCNSNETIELQNMTIKGRYLETQDLDDFTLNYYCNQLGENTWGCKKYLVIRK